MSNTIYQLKHGEFKTSSHTIPLVVFCENFLSPENVGMTFRICDAMGAKHLYLSGSTPTLPNRKLAKAARSAHKKIPFTYDLDTANLLQQLKSAGYTLVGLETTNQSKDIRKFNFQQFDKIALIAGAERYGISEATLNFLDTTVHIPMFGIGSSMNVVTAISIGLYEITRQKS